MLKTKLQKLSLKLKSDPNGMCHQYNILSLNHIFHKVRYKSTSLSSNNKLYCMHGTFSYPETPYIRLYKLTLLENLFMYQRCIIDVPTTRCIHGIDALRNYNSQCCTNKEPCSKHCHRLQLVLKWKIDISYGNCQYTEMSLDHISHIPVLVSTMKFTTEYRNKRRYLTLNYIEYNSSVNCNLSPSQRKSSRQLFSTILFYHYRHNLIIFKIM